MKYLGWNQHRQWTECLNQSSRSGIETEGGEFVVPIDVLSGVPVGN